MHLKNIDTGKTENFTLIDDFNGKDITYYHLGESDDLQWNEAEHIWEIDNEALNWWKSQAFTKEGFNDPNSGDFEKYYLKREDSEERGIQNLPHIFY